MIPLLTRTLTQSVKFTPFVSKVSKVSKLSAQLAFYSTKKKKPLTALDGFRRSTNTPELVLKILKLLNKSDTYDESTTTELSKYLKLVTAITVSEGIDFPKLVDILSGTDVRYNEIVPGEVIHIAYPDDISPETKPKELFILSNGTIIGWNFNESQLLKIIPRLTSTLNDPYKYESDEFDFIELDELPPNPKNNGNSYMINDIILIQNINQQKKLLDKVAFSIGLSRSTRISILENDLEEFLKLTRINSDKLANGLKINASEHEILKLTGKLFLLRGKLNLYNELIDTPDLYWSEPTLEKIYQQVSTNLDIYSRISILNRKIDYATEEQRAFLSLLNEKKSTKLEWTIIILILIEVGFETYNFVNHH